MSEDNTQVCPHLYCHTMAHFHCEFIDFIYIINAIIRVGDLGSPVS